jgi:hypothetical protein|tara:strand:- start:2535 stop:2747 length:213 start_codon:yes stop_codon:yes gene_type:complete
VAVEDAWLDEARIRDILAVLSNDDAAQPASDFKQNVARRGEITAAYAPIGKRHQANRVHSLMVKLWMCAF